MENAGAEIIQQFETPDVRFSRPFLNNVLQHLLANAIHYRNPERKLCIQLKSYKNANGNIILACTDNGLGMDLKSYGTKLFGLYATFHQPLSGRGVGLYLIKTQAESLGGKISVSSTPGEGSTFRVIFPAD
ncbi:MAG: ATP-binding protein [Sphingobacteriaceae bacterium]|nr:MAG: ATP-binding protein [Sphingobacteriaceae bacterium]